ILTEAAAIGLVAAVLGLALGIWLGEQLLLLVSQSINDFYFRVSVTEVTVGAASIIKGMVAGVGATLFAAAVPAFEAASYQPRLALTRSVLERQTHRLMPFVAATGIATMLLAVIVLALSERNLVAGLASVFMLIMGFALCVPLVVRAATSGLAPLARKAGGTPSRMAVAGIATSLSRTGVAIVALAVAVSATIGVSVMVDSFRGSVNAWLEQTLQADIYFGVERGTLDPDLVSELVALPGIEAFSTGRRAWLEDGNGRTRVFVVQMAPGGYAGTEILDADPGEVWATFEADDVVLVSESYAYMNRVARGDVVPLRTDSGKRDFRVAAVYQSFDIDASALLMSRAIYDRHWSDPGIGSVGLYLDPQANVDELIATLKLKSAGRQELRINSNVKIRELSLQIFDRTFVITDILYWLALGVAIIGILGAMLALQLERAREFAVLRALGMTPAQLGGMITLQTGMIGLLSGLAAVPLGIIMAYMLIEVVNRRAFGWQIDMSVEPGILLSSVLLAVAAALLAGIYPALRAARSQPALAMREE
ncbi:MAG: ABC transporter permease, partial [Xanthomonadales bacterium]|nr:ABC transporter permease [Xanthomonadales bacterium]